MSRPFERTRRGSARSKARIGTVRFLIAAAALAGVQSAEAEPAPLEQVNCDTRGGFWARARRAQEAQYCQALVRAGASLWAAPKRARPDIDRALSLLQNGLQARLLAAEWQLSVEKPKAAHKSFQGIFAELERARAGESQAAFHSVLSNGLPRVSAARAALLARDYGQALNHYRAAVLSPSDRVGPSERARVFIEAAVAASYESASHYREAEAYLAQASREHAPLLTPIIAAARRLLVSRSGKPLAPSPDDDQEFSLAWIFERVPAAHGAPGELLPVLPPGEAEAMVAIWSNEASAWMELAEDWDKAPTHLLAHARAMAQR